MNVLYCCSDRSVGLVVNVFLSKFDNKLLMFINDYFVVEFRFEFVVLMILFLVVFLEALLSEGG